ncbi:MAG TPA: NYN domain-containing protein [Streptosporangiaceae bacterium]
MSHNQNARLQRVAVYYDGFNLYHGIHDLAGRRFLWLDLQLLAKHLIRPGQKIEAVRYFTALIRNNESGLARQRIYHNALLAQTSVEVVLGRFQEKSCLCFSCGTTWQAYEEKETDVSIAVSLVEDAVNNRFDTALVISADSDLCPAMRAIRRLKPQLRIIAVFPPRRRSGALRRESDAVLHINEIQLRGAQLPDVVQGTGGRKYRRPAYWS